ncbi:hypothetical protein JTB14_018049 [Gonioctena quinquepunctata]|nr:hypothetical protein JTB14_018049 [Gonioctena quinquepunctata]
MISRAKNKLCIVKPMEETDTNESYTTVQYPLFKSVASTSGSLIHQQINPEIIAEEDEHFTDFEDTFPVVLKMRQILIKVARDNEGFHYTSTDTPYCFTWKEGVTGRGSQEVGSCVKKYVDLSPDIQELILWSDSFGGQNRNIKITLLLKAIISSHPSLRTVSSKYLLPGHSYLANDRDFGEIERAL